MVVWDYLRPIFSSKHTYINASGVCKRIDKQSQIISGLNAEI